MITERDLQEAIASCEGDLHPKAATCIKLASFYTIRDHMFPQQPMYSFAAPPPEQAETTIDYESGTDFGRAVHGKDPAQVWPIMDELMEAIQVLQPRLYASVMSKL